MNRCENCDLYKNAIKQCAPKGTNNPSIYFIGEAPGPEEDKQGIPFIGKAGSYLHEIIDVFGLNENNCRFFNVVRCIPKDSPESSFRQPTDHEIECCINNLIDDINNTKPKVIVTLGYTASRALCPDIKGGITQNRGIVFEYNGYIVVPTYHPSYLIRQSNNNKIRIEFKKDIKLAIALCIDPSRAPKRRNTTDNKSGTITCKNYEEFDKFCKDQIDDFSDIGYDVETNALEVHSKDHRVVGFSLASNKDTGCYVPFKSLDYEMDLDEKKKIEDKLSTTLTTKNIIQYNCMHELPVTLNWLNIEMPKIDDIFVMVKLMMGNADKYKGSGGLKAQSVEYLNYNDWSEDLDLYFTYILDYENSKDNMIALLSKYYDNVDDIISKVEDVAFNVIPTLPKGTISYEYVPCNLISRYGSIDSSVLFELRDFYYEWMDKESSKLGIDLHKGYKYWMMHHYSGYILEKNGAYWNDEKANVIEEWCLKNMNESLRYLIKSPLSEKYLRDKLYIEFLKYLKDNHISEMLGPDFTPKRLYKTSVSVIPNNDNGVMKLSRMSLTPIIRKRKDKPDVITNEYKLQLGNIETLGKKFLFDNPNLFEDWYKSYISKYTDQEHTIDEYKTLINPNASASDFKSFISDLLLTPMIRYAKTYMNLRVITEEPDYNVNYYKNFFDNNKKCIDNSYKYNSGVDISNIEETHPYITLIDTPDSELLSLIHKLEINSDITPSRRLDIFIKYMSGDRVFYNKRVKRAINNALSYSLDSLDSTTMNEVYDLYLMCHIDVEDSSTWNQEFEWLFHYKVFKKFSKLISTYINGKVGRRNVFLVDKKSYSGGDYFTRREKLYSGKDIPEDKTLLMQQSFSVNTADTGRWQCLSGDTLVPLLDGRTMSLEDLEGYGDFYVYSYDYEQGHIVPGYCKYCACTGRNVPILNIELDNGEVIKCTPEHKFMKRNGHYIKAKDIKPGQSLMPLYRRISKDGYEEVYLVNEDKWYRTHHLCQEMIYGRNWTKKNDGSYYVSHHKDFDKTNNDPRNLCRVDVRKHYNYHSRNAKWRAVWNNEEKAMKVRTTARNMMLKRNKDKDYQNKCHEGMIKWLKDPNNFKRKSDIGKKNIKICHIKRENNQDYIDSRKRSLNKFWKEMYSGNTERSKDFLLKKSSAGQKSHINKGLKLCSSLLDRFGYLDKDLYESSRKEKKRFICWSKLVDLIGSEEDIVRYADSHSTVNHKVVSVEFGGYIDKVYDLHVEKYHNFALDSGIVVHNSGMHNLPASDAIKGIYTSRFKGGCIAMPDGSQMEVRTLAAECKDENLLKAFRDGVDIHRFFASKIYRVDYDAVESWQRGLAKNAVFGMIYGESEKAFADTYLKGDLSQAEKVFNDMFTGFPKIKEYIDRAQNQYKEFSKVTTITQRYINMNDPRIDPNTMLRRAQNYPIQAAAEDLAGIILYKLCEYINTNNMKSKIFCFIHDSIEIDMHPDEVFQLIDKINYLFNVFPLKEFGVPVACDVPLGPSMGQECEVKEMKHDDSYNEVNITLAGFIEDINELVDIWREVYHTVEFIDEDSYKNSDKESYVPWSDVFLPKKAKISMYTGKMKHKGERKIHIVRK